MLRIYTLKSFQRVRIHQNDFPIMDAGTAIGVTSLGIQVCQGLLDYYRDWKDYDGDIRETYTKIAELNKTFLLVDDKLRSLPGSAFQERAKDCLLTCQDGVKQLEKKLKKVHREAPAGLKQKTQAGILRLLYPFRKSTLEKLGIITQALMQQLNLALQVVQLDISDSTRATATRIEDAVQGIVDVTSRMQAFTLDTQTQLATTVTHVHKLVTEQDAKTHAAVLDWLAAPDRAIEHEAARKKHEVGTGEWLLTSDHYREWISGHTPLLWLHGKAGCCKTVLCSSIIDNLQSRLNGLKSAAFAYFYFTFADSAKQSYRALLLSMVTELSRKPPLHASLLRLYEDRKPQAASEKALEDVLITLIQQATLSFLVADALDECSEEQREQIIEGFKRITQACPATRVLITSRREADIEDLMGSWCETQLALDEGCVNADIDIFVKTALATDRKLMRLPTTTKQEIKDMFHKKSDGMYVPLRSSSLPHPYQTSADRICRFRWAALQLEAVRNLKILRPSYISTALHAMPRTLDETYERILSAIDDMYFNESRTALEWLVFGNAPLSVAELADACSISIGRDTEPSLMEGGHEAIMGLLSVISPLVLISDADPPPDPDAEPDYNCLPTGTPYPAKFVLKSYSQRIRLAHFSVKEHLLSSRLQKSAPQFSRYAMSKTLTHRQLAQRCCGYLVYFSNQSDVQTWIKEERIPTQSSSYEWGGFDTQDYLEDLTPAYPLLPYVCKQWIAHLKCAEESLVTFSDDEHLHLRVLTEEKVRVSWLRLYDPSGNFVRDPVLDEDAQRRGKRQPGWRDSTRALYWASFLGLHKTVSSLCNIKTGLDLDHEGGKYGTALQAAAYQGHDNIIDILLDEGCQAGTRGGLYGTALGAAAWSGHKNIVSKLILASPQSVLVRAGDCGTALQAGIHGHDEQIVAELLQAGADPNILYQEPTPEWSRYGPRRYDAPRVVSLLHMACRLRNAKIVELLVKAGAKVERFSHQLLQEATYHNQEEIFRMLLQASAVVDLSSGKLLSEAARHGNDNMTKLLLQADTANNKVLYASLRTAISLRHREVAQTLINAGAEVDIAAYQAAIDTWPSRGTWTYWEDRHRNGPDADAIAQLLIDSGLKVAQGPHLLIEAAAKGSVGMVKSLLQAGVDICSRTNNPLWQEIRSQAQCGFDVFQWNNFSLELSFQDQNKFDVKGGSALMVAARNGYADLVQFLLDAGADPNETGLTVIGARYGNDLCERPTSALIKAMIFGIVSRHDKQSLSHSISIVQKLLNGGVDVNKGGEALCKAISYSTFFTPFYDIKVQEYENSIKPLVQLLLDKGADFNGPLSSLPSMIGCASDTDTTAFVHDLLIEHLVWDSSRTKCKEVPRDCHMSLILGCVMIAHKEDVQSLLKAQSHTQIGSWTVSEACELLAAACWTFLALRPKDCDVTVTLILDRMLEVRGVDDIVFADILSKPTLEISMKRFLESDEEHWLARVKALLKERLACSRAVNEVV